MTQGMTVEIGAAAFYGLFPSSVILPNPKLVNAFSSNLSSGDTDLYTVPSGRRAVFLGLLAYSAVDSVIKAEVKMSGSYYRLGDQFSLSAPDWEIVESNCYVGEAGEIFAVNASVTGPNVWGNIIEFDNTCGLASSKLTSLAAGDNTLYRVSWGKSALILPQRLSPANPSRLYIWNNSGGTRTYNLFSVPNGGVSGLTSKTQNNLSITTGTAFNSGPIAPHLNSNDSIVINTDASTATQFAFMTYIEV